MSEINYDIRNAPDWLKKGHLYKSVLEQVDEEDDTTYFIPIRPEFAINLKEINNLIELKIVIGAMRFWGLETVPYFVYDYLFKNETAHYYFSEQSKYSAFSAELSIITYMEIKDNLLIIELNAVSRYNFNDFCRELTEAGLLNLFNYINTILQCEIKPGDAFESILYKIIKDNYFKCFEEIIKSKYLKNMITKAITGQFYIIEYAIIYGGIDCLKIMLDVFDLQMFYHRERDIIICSIEKGSYDCFKHIYEYYETKNTNIQSNVDYLYLQEGKDVFMYYAIKYGRIDIVKYLLNKGAIIKRYHLILSIDRSFNIFDYCFNNSTVDNDFDKHQICCAVAKNTHLNKLKALVEKGYPFNSNVYNFAVVSCQLDVLKYLDSIGISADEHTEHTIKLMNSPENREKHKNIDEIIEYLNSTQKIK